MKKFIIIGVIILFAVLAVFPGIHRINWFFVNSFEVESVRENGSIIFYKAVSENVAGKSECTKASGLASLRIGPFGAITDYDDQCQLIVAGPWFEDYNHDSIFGVGPINVILYSYVKSYLDQNPIIKLNFGYNDTESPLSLRNRTLILRYTTVGLDDGSSLHFWLQVKGGPGGRATNIYYIDPLPLGYDQRVEIDLGNLSKYRCMSSSVRRIRTYGCDMSVRDSLSNVNVDLGIIRIPWNADPGAKPGAKFILGEFVVR